MAAFVSCCPTVLAMDKGSTAMNSRGHESINQDVLTSNCNFEEVRLRSFMLSDPSQRGSPEPCDALNWDMNRSIEMFLRSSHLAFYSPQIKWILTLHLEEIGTSV